MGKVKSSAFWWFMYHLQEKEYKRSGRIQPMGQISKSAGIQWAAMSQEERKPFIDRDKEYKAGDRPPLFDFAQQLSRNRVKTDSTPVKPDPDGSESRSESRSSVSSIRDKSRRTILLEKLREFIEANSDEVIVKTKFYFIASNVMCATRKEVSNDDCVVEDTYYPLEIAFVEFSIEEGIITAINNFTDPGPMPENMARICHEHAKKHEIPLSDFALAIGAHKDALGKYVMEERKSEFDVLVCDLHDFLVKSIIDQVIDDSGQSVKILFCLGDQIWQNKGCLKKIGQEADLEAFSEGIEVLDIADLFYFLCRKKGFNIKALVLDKLESSKFDFDERCEYHATRDVVHCALTVAKKFAWIMSETLCPLYGIELSSGHKPKEIPSQPTNISNDWVSWEEEIPAQPTHRKRYFDEDFDHTKKPVMITPRVVWPDSIGRGTSRGITRESSVPEREPPKREPHVHFPATDIRLLDGRLKSESGDKIEPGPSNFDHRPREPGLPPRSSPFETRLSNSRVNENESAPFDTPRPLGRGRARPIRPDR